MKPFRRRPCESRDPYAVHYREDTAYGSRLCGGLTAALAGTTQVSAFSA